MSWVDVRDELPRDGQAVLVRRSGENWRMDHSLADGQIETVWRWKAMRFRRGKTAEEVKTSGSACGFDQWSNNLVPYGWEDFGAGDLFGQEVSHWMPIYPPTHTQEAA